MRKLFTVVLMLVSLLFFSCSRMKDFYGIPFGSTKEDVKTYLQNEKWEIEEQEEIITAKKANGKYAGKTVKEMSFSFDVGRFYSASVVFYSAAINDEPSFISIINQIKEKYKFNKVYYEDEYMHVYENGVKDMFSYSEFFYPSFSLYNYKNAGPDKNKKAEKFHEDI